MNSFKNILQILDFFLRKAQTPNLAHIPLRPRIPRSFPTLRIEWILARLKWLSYFEY
jgi:hypothetical protein